MRIEDHAGHVVTPQFGEGTVRYRCGLRTNIRITYKSHKNHIRHPAADTDISLRTPPASPYYRITIRMVCMG